MSMLGIPMATNKNFFASNLKAEQLLETKEKSIKYIVRGTFAIDPATIETVALKHEAVAEAAAIGRPSRYTGQVPVLYITHKHGMDSAGLETTILNFLDDHLPDRFAIPVEVRLLPKLPKTTTGSIFKPYLMVKETEEMVMPVVERYLDKSKFKLNLSLSKDMQVVAKLVIQEDVDFDLTDLEADIEGLPVHCEIRYS